MEPFTGGASVLFVFRHAQSGPEAIRRDRLIFPFPPLPVRIFPHLNILDAGVAN